MASTYEPIATSTVSNTSTNTVSFTSIPQTYTDIVIVYKAGDPTGTYWSTAITFNGDNAGGQSNYSIMQLSSGTGISPNPQVRSIVSQQFGNVNQNPGMPTTVNSIGMINVMSYSQANTYKTILYKWGYTTGTYNGVEVGVNMWRSTAAINRIDMVCSYPVSPYNNRYFTNGSMFTLYGIKAA